MNSDRLCKLIEFLNIGPPKVGDDYIRCSCPFYKWYHDTSEPPSGNSCSFKVSDDDTSFYKCFVCNKKGTISSIFWDLEKLGLSLLTYEQRQQLKKEERCDIESRGKRILNVLEKRQAHRDKTLVKHERYSDEYVYHYSEYDCFSKNIHPYALKRGITEEAWNDLDMRFSERDQRVLQPMIRDDGKLIGAVGRAVNNNKLRHLPVLPFPKYFIYRENVVSERIVLFEGPFKAALAYAKGIKNAAALQGVGFTEEQLEALKSYGTIFLAVDGDKPGVYGAEKLMNRLKNSCNVFIIPIKSGEQLEELHPEEIQNRIEKRVPALTDSIFDCFRKFGWAYA